MKIPDRPGVLHHQQRTWRRSGIAIERTLLAGGAVLLGFFLAAYIHRIIMVRSSIRDFEKARQEQSAKTHVDDAASPADSRSQNGAAEMSSEQSKVENDAGRAGANVHRNAMVPLAILRIPRIHLEVPVLSGTDEITLNRGVGQIAGMAAPGEKGNIGIAGHRDGFFRNLKEINRGDLIELETTSASATYVVNRVLITGPDDTSVLQSSGEQVLTLVTCYPFHFIGPAPRRFVVQATLK